MNLTPHKLKDTLTAMMSVKPFSFHPELNGQALLHHIEEGLAWKPAQVALAQQVHGVRAAAIQSDPSHPIQRVPETDALVTNVPGLALAVTTSDCTAITLYDAQHQALGLAHAGWRGTLHGVLEATLGLMAELFHTAPEACQAILGPSIGGCCYEVGDDVVTVFRDRFGHVVEPHITSATAPSLLPPATGTDLHATAPSLLPQAPGTDLHATAGGGLAGPSSSSVTKASPFCERASGRRFA